MHACCREEVGRSCRGEADSDGSPPIRAMAPLSFSSSACGQASLQQCHGDLAAFALLTQRSQPRAVLAAVIACHAWYRNSRCNR